MRRITPLVPRGFEMRFPAKNWRSIAEILECSTIHVRERWLSERWLSERRVTKIKSAGYGLVAFTVNDPKRAKRLIERGVDCIITEFDLKRNLGVYGLTLCPRILFLPDQAFGRK